jgi:hypothetical protein
MEANRGTAHKLVPTCMPALRRHLCLVQATSLKLVLCLFVNMLYALFVLVCCMYKVQRARRTKLFRGRYVQEQNLLRAINLLFL